MLIIATIVLTGCFFTLANSAKAAGTTCTITLSAQTGHLITYEVCFRVWDNVYGTWFSPSWSSWDDIVVGTTYNFPIPLSVDPDCEN